jgi:hypothetical protein
VEDFAAFIQKQRDELQKKRNALTQEAVKIEEAIKDIDREMGAIHAYEMAKSGKTSKASGTTSTRTRRGGIRESVLETIKASGGISRADLLVQLDAKGDKAAEQSISNALANLKKAGTIGSANGVYTVAG